MIRMASDLVALKAPLERVKPGQLLGIEGTSAQATVLCERAGTLLASLCAEHPGEAIPNIPKDAMVHLLPGKYATAPLGNAAALLGGRVVDCNGRLLDHSHWHAGTPPLVPLFGHAPAQGQLKPICRSLHTGTMAIDALTPVGRGQSMMLFGESGTGKSSMVLDAVLAQATSDVHCVLSLSDGGASRGLAMLEAFRADPVLSSTLLPRCTVVAAVEASAAERLRCLAAAASIGESIRDAGGHALVIGDELRGLCELWDVAGDAVEALGGLAAGLAADKQVSAEHRIFYASYLQRSAQMSDALGGGSLSLVGLLRQHAHPEGGGGGDANDRPGGTPVAKAHRSSEPEPESAPRRVFVREDFAGRPAKERTRIEALLTRGVEVDATILEKLKIRVPLPNEPPDAQPPPPKTPPAPDEMLPVPLVPSMRKDSPQVLAARRSIYHTDQLTSLADGHIQLQRALFDAGRRPASLPTDSLARVGAGSDLSENRAQPATPAMGRVAQYLRLELAQARDLLPADPNESAVVTQQRTRAAALEAVLCRQTAGNPLTLSQELVLLHALATGHMDHLAHESESVVAREIWSVLDHVGGQAKELMAAVDVSGNLTDREERQLLGLAAQVLPAARGRAFFTNYDRTTWSAQP